MRAFNLSFSAFSGSYLEDSFVPLFFTDSGGGFPSVCGRNNCGGKITGNREKYTSGAIKFMWRQIRKSNIQGSLTQIVRSVILYLEQ